MTRSIIAWGISLALCLVVVPCWGQKSARVRQLEQQRKALTEEIQRTTQLLKKTTNTTANSLKKLNLLASKIAAHKKVIETLGAELNEADASLARLSLQMDSLQKQLQNRQEYYVRSVRAMQNRNTAKEYLLFILSAKDVQQGMRRMQYLREYAQWQKKEADKLKDINAQLQAKHQEVQTQRNQKNILLATREKEQAELQQTQTESQKEVKALEAKKKELQTLLAQKRKQAQQLNRQIEQQIAKEIAESEAKARREAEARKKAARNNSQTTTPARKAISKGGYAMNEQEFKLSGSFENNRGRLPAPISGSYSIIGRFGEHAHQSLTHVRVNNSGIDLQGAPGAVAKAVFEGVVTRIFVVEGYNNSIILRHGNYLTVYSNLTEVYVKTGDKVERGQSLGKVYSDPNMNGATFLHFQLWKERTKLNPERWIR